LADNEAIEFGDDFAGRKIGHALCTIGRAVLSNISIMRAYLLEGGDAQALPV
jgi:hypothetical protein